MSYYQNRKPIIAMAISFIVGGGVILSIGMSTGFVMVLSGLLMLGLVGYYANNPVLEVASDHLVFDPAPVKSKRFIAKEDVESVDLAGDDLLLALNDGEVVKLPVKALALVDGDELCDELNAWKASA